VKRLERVGDNEKLVSQIVQRLTQSYISADENTRNRIETGAVEHMMESPSMRKYFASWKGDPALGTAYELCLQWGKDGKLNTVVKKTAATIYPGNANED